MADENYAADKNYPRDPADDVDPADLAFVEHLLAGLAFLRPDDAPRTTEPGASAPVEPMPDWAWDRVSSAIAAETGRATTSPAARRSRLARWGGGLVAASVAVLAVGVGVTAFQGGGSGGAVVAGDAAPVAASIGAVAESRELAAEEAPNLDPAILQAPQALSAAGFVPPVTMLMRSDTDYTPDQLQTQVEGVLKEVGVDSAQEAEDLAGTALVLGEQAPVTGFTSSAERLRDCITSLTDSESSTALVIDRSTFEGQDAGIVIAPEYDVAPSTPASRPDMSELMVWVVDPDCNVTMQVWLRLRP